MGLKTENEDVTDQWQRNYGVPGREQYTAAIDLAQTKVSNTGQVTKFSKSGCYFFINHKLTCTRMFNRYYSKQISLIR
jgi:hypothetical protein